MELLYDFLKGFGYVGVYLLILLGAKVLKDLTSPYSLNRELTQQDNPAMAMAVSGYFLAVTAIFGSVIATPGSAHTYVSDLASVVVYGLVGIVLLNISRFINDRVLLWQFSNKMEIIEDHNIGTGVVVAGSYLSSGLIIAGVVYGEGTNIWQVTLLHMLIFWIIGQAALLLFGVLYRLITPYKVHDEIEKDNIAAGISFAGGLVAISLLIMRSVLSDSFASTEVNWEYTLAAVGLDLVAITVLLILARLFFDYALITGARLRDEIVEDRNIGAGVLEATLLLGFALVLSLLI